jgi:hypothetical protein
MVASMRPMKPADANSRQPDHNAQSGGCTVRQCISAGRSDRHADLDSRNTAMLPINDDEIPVFSKGTSPTSSRSSISSGR